VNVDAESLKLIGTEPFEKAHPNIPWQRQFEYARKLDFIPMIDFEKDLNPEQLRVVMEEHGPILVIAGAGSGKTRTLTFRVARLIESGFDQRDFIGNLHQQGSANHDFPGK